MSQKLKEGLDERNQSWKLQSTKYEDDSPLTPMRNWLQNLKEKCEKH